MCVFCLRVHKQQEEERLQRLVQEEAVKCLWKQVSDDSSTHLSSSIYIYIYKCPSIHHPHLFSPSPFSLQLQSVMTWQNTVMERLKCGSSSSSSRPCAPSASSEDHASIQTEFHSSGNHQGVVQDRIRATAHSPEIVLSAGAASGGNLQGQHLSFVQKRQEEEEKLEKET